MAALNQVAVEQPLTPFQIIENALDNIPVPAPRVRYRLYIRSNSESKMLIQEPAMVRNQSQYEFCIRNRSEFIETKADYVKSYIRTIEDLEVIFVPETRTSLKVYFTDPKIGFKVFSEYLIGVFKFKTIYKVLIDVMFINKGFIDWLTKEYEGNIQSMILCLQFGKVPDMKYLFDTCCKAKYLGFHCNPNLMLRYDPQFVADYIFIDQAYEITLENLIAMSNQSVVVSLYDCSVTCVVMNTFLKRWKSSREQMKMKLLYVSNSGVMREGVLSGIDFGRVGAKVVKRFSVLEGYSELFVGGFTIWRRDGSGASITVEPILCDDSYKDVVKIGFWPDSDGQIVEL